MSFLIAGGALTVVSGLFGMGSAKRVRRAANAEKKKARS